MREYPANLVARVRTLAAAGYTPPQIERTLRAQGIDPCPTARTIGRWCNEERWQRDKEQNLRRHRVAAVRKARERGVFRLYSTSPEYVTAFAQALRENGVTSTRAIRRVLKVTTGVEYTLGAVRAMLDGGIGRMTCVVCGEGFDPPAKVKRGRWVTTCERHRKTREEAAA